MESTPKKRGRPPKLRPVIDAPAENPVVKRKPGRPRKAEMGFAYVEGLAKIGMRDEEIMAKLKMGRRTWFRLLAEGSNRERLMAIRIEGQDEIRGAVYARAVHGDTGAARLVLEWLRAAGRDARKIGY